MTRNILIVGYGVAGRALAQDIRQRAVGDVIGFLDDGVVGEPVVGALSDVNSVIESLAVDLVYFAIPSAPAEVVRRFVDSIERQNVELAIIPRTYAILTKETVDIDDLTDVDVLDLVGREPVKHDLIASTHFISGKTVLVTGAAGSIGSRLVSQLLRMKPRHVVCVDWWENGVFRLQQEFEGADNISFHVADIKVQPRMEQIFVAHRPDIVFHAAAYKHVPLMQSNPLEAVNNNVWGSLSLMRIAHVHRVASFVLISTDKAVNPVNVMGATKRLAEILMEIMARRSEKTRFTAVRFGNVIQSNGSVMETFRKQIAMRKPLTVTHEDVTRFFMTLDEASQLVIQTAFAGENGDTFVLDMGEPVRILELARSLVKAVDPSLRIEIVGLRPGEKLFEELSYQPDRVGKTENPKILVVRDAGAADPEQFAKEVDDLLESTLSYSITPAEVVDALRTMGFAVQLVAPS